MVDILTVISKLEKDINPKSSLDCAFLAAIASVCSIYLSENLTLMIETAETITKVSAKNLHLNIVEGELVEEVQ